MSEAAIIDGIIGGPASVFLEAELRSRVRNHHLVVWLDLDDHYSGFVDRLAEARAAGELAYEVRAFRGSHLQLMMELEDITSGAEMKNVVIHLPGFNREVVEESPLLELHAVGNEFRKALDTLITEAAAGKLAPHQVTEFLAQDPLTLEAADAWLDAALHGTAQGLATQLRAMTPEAVLDDLLRGGFVAGRIRHDAVDAAAFWDRWNAWTGLPDSWRDTNLRGDLRPEDAAFVVAGWALCVEYVDDLRRDPVNSHLQHARGLARGVIDKARSLAEHLRQRHVDVYQHTVEETELLLADEVGVAKAEDLGKIDTFRFEEDVVLGAALAGLAEGSWDTVAEWAGHRIGTASETSKGRSSFWLGRDPHRKFAWELVQSAAELGRAIQSAGKDLSGCHSLGEALAAYGERGAAVDRAHRHLEQRRAAVLFPQLPEFETLRARLDEMRQAWRRWADAWAIDFNALCRSQGFLPAAEFQQRTLFDQVVKPMVAEGDTKTAFFVVDAFRYEMAVELHGQLSETATTSAHLKARLAELPTVSEVGMNVLAPVASAGKLTPALAEQATGGKILGFDAGEFRVRDPETRRRAMHDRVGGATCPLLSLGEVLSRDSTSLKRAISQASLLVVHSREIDEAGEKGAGPAVFEQVLQKLRAAWTLLREAGVRRFVFTADHGFLLLDESAGAAQGHGRRIDPHPRHVLSRAKADSKGEVRVALSDLGYGAEGWHLLMPETTAVFDRGRRASRFVHGGNSLQERVIPVLTVVHQGEVGGGNTAYVVQAKARDGIAGMHCVEVRVEVAAAQSTLNFGSAQEIELALGALEADDVNVELCQTRGAGRLQGSAILAPVGESFEIFFRLSGPRETRVLVELSHPSASEDVQAGRPSRRFAVSALRSMPPPPVDQQQGAPAPPDSTSESASESASESSSELSSELSSGRAWLADLPEGGVRQVFEHLAVHGTVTEGEVHAMLGSARLGRRFAMNFEGYAESVPFAVRIDSVAGVKRYVRVGGTR